ncbi:MAG: hypothetical protein ACN4G0_15905 [Polyangiales bacterium]
MNVRTTISVLIALSLGFASSTLAQEEEDPTRPPPPRSPLPVEDPTIHEERHEVLLNDRAPAAEKESGAKEPSSDAETDADEEEAPTAGALPVEDPTIHEPAEDPEEPGSTDGPGDDSPTDGEESAKERGNNVSVGYGYQGGLVVGVDDWFYLALSGLVQARYAVNYRTKPPTDATTDIREKQVTQGFDVARARFHLGVGLTEFVALYMRIGVVAGGDFSFQRAFIDLKWKYLRLRAGLFMNETIAESLINPNDLYFNDYSILENVFSPGSSKGVMFTYLRKRFSINLGYSDGLRTGFSEIRSATRADFAVTLRTQYGWGERGLGGFNRLISRRGTPLGIRLGGAVHYQDGGRSQGTADVKIAFGTIDLSVRGSGWSLLASVTSGQDGRTGTTEELQNVEVVSTAASIMGGYFVMDDLQVFGQYAVVSKPNFQGEPPPTVPGLTESRASSFQAFGVGFTYFVIPGHDNVKLSSDFQYFLGREEGSTVPASPLNNIQPNDDGSQFFWRIQISAAF